MTCFRCRYEFCWCCMGRWHDQTEEENLFLSFDPTCPQLPFSLPVNLAITFTVLLFLPLVLLLGFLTAPIIAFRYLDKMLKSTCVRILCWSVLFIPASLLISALLIAIGLPITLIIGYTLINIFLVKLMINSCCGC